MRFDSSFHQAAWIQQENRRQKGEFQVNTTHEISIVFLEGLKFLTRIATRFLVTIKEQ